MVQQHQTFGWLWQVRFEELQKKRSTTGNTKVYHTANTQQEDQHNTVTLKDALEHLQQEYLLVNKIADAIVDNELASDSQRDYSNFPSIQRATLILCRFSLTEPTIRAILAIISTFCVLPPVLKLSLLLRQSFVGVG